ncbi:DUF2934 domain-containing protein [Salipiger bermudensis]|uniref:DUF2934 domain-containing protein n=1 Tax=Salipiger bermudensis TaxID=344736 RepID=UPI001C98F14E|nr:DUF2934 domain-containing protein [Salipiger bermudensis]MBY6005439.1 DUF2934 domain-containing protein [Salipiger bermudensis]
MSTTTPTEAEIAETAYFLWMEAGCPDGRDAEHWQAAIDALTITEAPKRKRAPAKPKAEKVAAKPKAKAAAKPKPAAKAKASAKPRAKAKAGE